MSTLDPSNTVTNDTKEIKWSRIFKLALEMHIELIQQPGCMTSFSCNRITAAHRLLNDGCYGLDYIPIMKWYANMFAPFPDTKSDSVWEGLGYTKEDAGLRIMLISLAYEVALSEGL